MTVWMCVVVFAFGGDNSPKLTAATADGETTSATAEANGDWLPAWNRIRTWLKARPGPATVFLPAGEFRTSEPLGLLAGVDYKGRGVERTVVKPLDAKKHRSCLLYSGSPGWHTKIWEDNVHGWSLTGMTLDAENADSAPAVHAVFAPQANRCLVRDVRVVNCRREGLILNGDFNTVIDFSADLVGTGSAHRGTTSSALNMGGNRGVAVRPVIRRSGQGLEFSTNDGVIIQPDIADAPPAAACTPAEVASRAIGLHLGSANNGANGITIVDPRVGRLSNGLLASNGNGLIGGLTVVRGVFEAAPCHLGGTRASNMLANEVPGLCPPKAPNHFVNTTFADTRGTASVRHLHLDCPPSLEPLPTYVHRAIVNHPSLISSQARAAFFLVNRWKAPVEIENVEFYLGKRLPRAWPAFSFEDTERRTPRPDVRFSGTVITPDGNRLEAGFEKETR